MKLIYRLALRLSMAFVVILSFWAVFFYYTMIEEIQDETDDALENFMEQIIVSSLGGQELPTISDGSNNNYYIIEVDEEYKRTHRAYVFSDEEVFIDSKNEYEPARVLKSIFQDGDGRFYELTVSTPTIEKFDLKISILIWIIILFFILLITIILVSVIVLNRSMKPLYKLLIWLDKYKIGETNESLKNKTNITEFRKLNEAVQRQIMRSENAFRQQKQFIGNASHELQTPLAICQNRLEMLASNPDISEDLLMEIDKTQKTISSLIRLNKTLLFLSKIDNMQFPTTENVNLNGIVKQQVEDLNEIFFSKNISVDMSENGEFIFPMNDSLGTALISNLLKNAYIHNVENGSIDIKMCSGQITISNTGPEKSLDSTRIFERFYQGDKKKGSSGLGLAIVESICKMYKLDVRYYFRDDKHFFEIKS